MPRATLVQNQFTRGELSPRMKGRTDLDQYFQGCRTQANFLSLPHGGATNRPGSVYVAETADPDTAGRLRPFVFSASDAYALEFGDGTLRFFRDRGRIAAPETDAAIANGAFESGIAGWTDRSTGGAGIGHDAANRRLDLVGDGAGAAVAEQRVEIGAAHRSSLHVLRFDVAGAAGSGAAVLRVGSTPGAGDVVDDAAFGHGHHCREFDPGGSAAVHVQFRNAAAGRLGIGGVALISGGVVEIRTPYAAADLLRIQHVQDADTMFLVHPRHKPMELARSGHASWSLTRFAPTGDPFTAAGRYPAAVALFEQRLVFGYTDADPQRLFFSRSADLRNMTTGTGAADGFTKDLFASQANPIRWIVGGSDLIVGAAGGEWVVDRPASGAVTVANFSVKRRETSGVAAIAPAEIDNRVLFVARRGAASNDGEDLLEFRFDDGEAEFVAPDLTLVSEHIADGGIVEMAWQQRGWKGRYLSVDLPASKRVLWLARADGVLLSFTYNFHELVAAWARHTWSGADAGVESVATIPGASGDEVWLIVRRTIDGATKRYVEYLDPDCFVDSGVTGTSVPATRRWSGLGHLEGETVAVLADGAPVAPRTVASGAIELDAEASTVQAGLPFTPEIELMPLEVPLPDGGGVGAAKSIGRVIVRLLSTVGATITASSRTAGDEAIFREVSDPVRAPIPPFTGDKTFTPPASWADATVKIAQNDPLPVTVQAVAMEVEAHR